MNLDTLKYKAARVSDLKFGIMNPPTAPMLKLKEEVDEVLECLNKLEDPEEEFADCLLLLIDAYRKYYGTNVPMKRLLHIASKKLDVVMDRKWGEPDENGVFKHIKENVQPETKQTFPYIDGEWFKETFDAIGEEWGNHETAVDIVIRPLSESETLIEFTVNADRYGYHKHNKITIKGLEVRMDLCELLEGGDIEYHLKDEIIEKLFHNDKL